MLENNNKAVVRKIINRSIKCNKIRNIFVILAIVLTTFMISSVFSIGVSLVENYQTMMERVKGTTAYIELTNPTNSQIKALENLDVFKSIGGKIYIGDIVSKNLDDKKIMISYRDDVNFKEQVIPAISDIVGNYPTKNNEIISSRKSLDELGIKDPKVGMNIALTYNINGKIQLDTFILSGYYTSYTHLSNLSDIMVSKEFINKHSLSVEKNGVATFEPKYFSEKKAYSIFENDFKVNKGQKVYYSSNPSENTLSEGMAVATIVGLISLFLIISGYLLIYNVLYIGVTKDISFYGLLKTIGTSPSQIKKIVKGQAMKLSVIGIAIGLVLGALVSFWVVPLALKSLNGEMITSEVSFNPIIFIGAGILSLLTTMLGCRKPAKIAGNMSPVEAVRFLGGKENNIKKSKRKTKDSGKIYKMAWFNVFRERNRAVIVFLSLFMGLITVLSVNTFISSLGVDNYVKSYLPHSFKIQNDERSPGNFGEDFIEKIKNINGVEKVGASLTTKFQLKYENWFSILIENDLEHDNQSNMTPEMYNEMIKNNPEYAQISLIGLEDNVIEKWNKETKNPINVEDFKKGKTALFTASTGSSDKGISPEYKDAINSIIGESMSGKEVKTGVENIYKLAGIPEKGIPMPHSGIIGLPIIFVSNNAIRELTKSPTINHINVDAKESKEEDVKNELTTMLENNSSYKLTDRTTETERFKSSINVMNTLGSGLGVILALVGILNFINTMVTSVNVRMKEIAVMESIGMTKKQVKKMLTFEGLYYAGITAALMLTLGMGIVYMVAKLAVTAADYAEFVFPGGILVILTAVIFVICLSIPRIVYTTVSKKTVVERLRQQN